ncbi:MAG: FtsX-like permease family protein, partial [Rikenellaceae bacterium]
FRSTDKPLIDYQSGEMDALPTVVLNESALRAFHSSVDSVIVSSGSSFHVIGVVPDVITTSMHSAVEPIMYAKDSNCKELVVKVEGKSANDAIAGIRNIVKEIEPSEYWSVKFYDKYLAEMYVNERDLSMLITLFSFLAIIISLMGVFGLVAFETQRRCREISLRRINGASVAEVVVMFNRRFALLVAISFVVAAPLAYYAVEQWLSGFAYRTPIYVWVFAVALLIVFVITFLTVTIKSLNAAVENPIETLKR